MRVLGHNTVVLKEPWPPLADVMKTRRYWFAVVIDPIRGDAGVSGGSVAAVSKTRDGAYRALMALGKLNRKVTVTRLS